MALGEVVGGDPPGHDRLLPRERVLDRARHPLHGRLEAERAAAHQGGLRNLRRRLRRRGVLRKTFLPCFTLSWAPALRVLEHAYDRDNAYADVDSEAIGQRLFFGIFTLQMFTK